MIFHIPQILRQCIPYSLEQLAIGRTQRVEPVTLVRLLGKCIDEIYGTLDRHHCGVAGARARDVVEQVLQELDREIEHCGLLALIDYLLEHAVKPAEQRFDRDPRRLLVISQCHGKRLGGIQ